MSLVQHVLGLTWGSSCAVFFTFKSNSSFNLFKVSVYQHQNNTEELDPLLLVK